MFLLYMAAINTDPFTNGSISTIIEDGLAYYIISPGCPLFKATKRSATLDLRRGRLSFFGVYNLDQAYIESYENEYGIIFAFETMRPYKLLALDHPATKTMLYNRAPENIKRILRKNYGYNTMTGSRDSELDSDLALSQYLCDEGYEGYATNFMQTETGEFHPEFMICRVDGLRPLGRITNDPRKIANILERGRIDQASQELKVSRKGKQRPESPSAARARPRSFAPTNLFASYDSPPRAPSRLTFGDMETDNQENISPNLFRSGLFADDSDDEDKRGGSRKRRSYKKKKTRTNKRKRTSRTRRRR
jgi:hypothetical protein